jgi:hypothetical protein
MDRGAGSHSHTGLAESSGSCRHPLRCIPVRLCRPSSRTWVRESAPEAPCTSSSAARSKLMNDSSPKRWA